MLELIFEVLEALGWFGLILGVAIEAASIPFPAALFVLAYGYLLNPGWWEILLFSIFTTLTYMAVSLIPFWISIKYEDKLREKLPKRKVKFAQEKIEKYGDWMIAVGRLIGMGYISYIAGFCQISVKKFLMLTFIGFYPLSVLMFYLGTLGNVEAMAEWFQNTQGFIFAALVLGGFSYILFRIYRRKKYDAAKEANESCKSS
ncbi:DedA family protein [Evansella clarkii]|uniref:DedA family protein n=1 Tax=Evansella clarkii TaxID=79879 RepID=UPI000B42F72C|nr:VTT domain-containing protein [Evansella clarkii]